MTEIVTVSSERGSTANPPLEKTPLQSYVAPAKPSLIGLSRAALADRLAEIGVAPAQRKMRVQQLWHWMYFRGAKNFGEMTSISKDMRAELEKHFTVDRPEVVAEIAFNEIQASSYPGGVTLRFARVKRYRDDKTAAEADTIATIQEMFRRDTGQ